MTPSIVRSRVVAIGLCAASGLLWCPAAQPQTYPTKPIRILSASPVGNSGDITMRLVIPLMATKFGQPLVMEARPSASGTVAAMAVKEAAPDGYTLFFGTTTTLVSAYYMMKSVRFDPLKDFSLISEVMNNPSLFAVSAALPVNSVKEFVDYARRNPGSIACGSTGVGSVFHILCESFDLDNGVKMLHVPYTGGIALPVGDLASGRIQLFWPSVTSIKPVMDSGKVKILAVVDKAGLKAFPQYPPITDALPRITLVPAFFMLAGPAGMPQPIMNRIQSALRKALHTPEVATKLEALGITPVGSPPDEFAAHFKRTLDLYGAMTKTLKLEPQ